MSYNKKLLKQMIEESKQKKPQPKPKDRIVDPMGQWKYPGQVTRIPSNRITMRGVPYPVKGIGSTGQEQMMYPGQEYSFPGSDYVDEYPLIKAQRGLELVKNIVKQVPKIYKYFSELNPSTLKTAKNLVSKPISSTPSILRGPDGKVVFLDNTSWMNAIKQGKQNLVSYLKDPRYRAVVENNQKLANRTGLNKKLPIQNEMNNPSLYEARIAKITEPIDIADPRKLELAIMQGSNVGAEYSRLLGGKGAITIPRVYPVSDVIRKTQHEVLHHIYPNMGEVIPSFTPLEVAKVKAAFKSPSELRKIEEANGVRSWYLDDADELLPNSYDFASELGISKFQKYPGQEAFKKMLDGYSGTKKFIKEAFNLNTSRDYKRVWDLLTGTLVATVPFVTGNELLDEKRDGGEPTPLDLAKIKAKMAMESHFGNPSARRMTTPYPQDLVFKLNAGPDKGKMGRGTHWMGTIDNYAVPNIQEGSDGKLFFNQNASPLDREAMRFNSPEDAASFAEYYKYVAPMMRPYRENKEEAFQKFFKTLPFNLRVDSPDYNLRGYWEALGSPEKFDYSQPKEEDGFYHAFSRNPQTGEILKRPQHPTFKMAIEEDRKAGYYPIVTPEGKIKTVSGKEITPGQSIYANGGDISIPNLQEGNWLNRYDDGGSTTSETTRPIEYFSVPNIAKASSFNPTQARINILQKQGAFDTMDSFYDDLFNYANKRVGEDGKVNPIRAGVGSALAYLKNPNIWFRKMHTLPVEISNREDNPYGVTPFSTQSRTFYPSKFILPKEEKGSREKSDKYWERKGRREERKIRRDIKRQLDCPDGDCYQDGGSTDSHKEFLKNWYQNRVIPDQYIQEGFNLDKPAYIKSLSGFPEYTYVDNIDNDPNITGRYEGDTGKLLLTKNSPEHVKTHELNHFLNQANDAGSYMRTIHGDIVRNELRPQFQLTGPYKDQYEYFSNPDEVHSRIMVLREKAGFKPDEIITPEKIQNFLKTYKGDIDNINDLLELSNGEEGLLNMLNFMAKNDRGKRLTQAKNGGPISPKDFTLQYIKSPKYRERLIKSGYTNVDEEIKKRYNSVSNTNKIITQSGPSSFFDGIKAIFTDHPYSAHGGSSAHEKNVIWYDPKQAKEIGATKDEVLAHEFSHKETRDDNDDAKVLLNQNDIKQLVKRLNPKGVKDLHDKMADENKADLNAVRYWLYNNGVDIFNKDITVEDLKKAMNSKKFLSNRLFRNYKFDDALWLINNVAVNNPEYNTQEKKLSFAKNGGESYLPKAQDGVQVGGYLPKHQKKGEVTRLPLYVNNPNDPRLQAYQDSLYLYNNSEKRLREFRRFGDANNLLYVNPNPSSSYLPFEHPTITPIDRTGFVYNFDRNNPNGEVRMVQRDGSLNRNLYQEASSLQRRLSGNPSAIIPIYKKPVQSVILQKERPQIKMVGNERVQSTTPSFNFSSPRLSTIEKPKGNYAVDYFDENLAPQTNYFPTPEIADMFMQERMRDKMYGPSMTRRGVYDDGGSLPKAQNGWQESGDVTKNNLLKGKDFIDQWMKSPMYKSMLEASAQGPELERIRQGRITSFNVPSVVTSSDLSDKNEHGSTTHRVRTMLNATVDERNEMMNVLQNALLNPKNKELQRKAENIMKPTITGWDINIDKSLKPGTVDYESVLAHEYGHTSGTPFINKDPNQMSRKELDEALALKNSGFYIPQLDVEKMRNYQKNKQLDKFGNYISNPEETRQFLNQTRYLGKQQGIYDPYTEKITPEQFKKIDQGVTLPIDSLRNLYNDDQIVEMLNSISKRNNIPLTQAQEGGENKKYIRVKLSDGGYDTLDVNSDEYAKLYDQIDPSSYNKSDKSYSLKKVVQPVTKKATKPVIKKEEEYITPNVFTKRSDEMVWKENVPGVSKVSSETRPTPKALPSRKKQPSLAERIGKSIYPQIALGSKIVGGLKQASDVLNEGWEIAKGLPSGLERLVGKYQEEKPESITKTAEKIKNIQKQKRQVTDSLPIQLGYTQYDVIPDYGKDSLVSFSNVFDNDLGAEYIIGNKVKEVTDAGAPRVFKNARAVAHFLRDSDILPNQKITPPSWTVSKGYTYNTTSPGKTVSAGHLNEMDWNRTLYKPIPGTDKWRVKYLKPGSTENLKDLEKQGWSTDFTVSMQHKFSDIDWDKEGPSTGYKTKSKWLPLKNNSHTYIPYRDKNAFSRFSGGSVTFLLKDPKTGKSIGADFAGSVNAIKEYGKYLIKTFNVKPEDLEVVYHDMGSYSAKPKAKPDGTLSYDQWINYNTYNKGFSGAPLIIPIKEDGGPIPAYARGPMVGDIQMRGNVNIPTQIAYDASQARKAQAAREATTIGADTRTAAQKAKDAQYAAEINKRRKDLGFIEGTGHTQQAIEKNRAEADRIIHNFVDVPMTVMGAGELAYLGSKGVAKALPELGEYLKKGFLKNTSPTKANFFSDLASKQNVITPSGTPAIAKNEIEALIQREIDRLDSDEYILRRMETTGESIDQIRKSTQKWINEYKKQGVNKMFKFVSNLDNKALATYTRELSLFNPFRKIPKIRYKPDNRVNMLQSIDHEIKHHFSPALRNEELYKNYPKLEVGKPEKRTIFQRIFNTKPFTEHETSQLYLSDMPEQQVRAVRFQQRVLDDLKIPEYRKITKDEFDDWLRNYFNKNSENYIDEGFGDVASLLFFAKQEAKGAPIKKDILHWLNKAWAIPTGALGAKSLEQKKEGGQTNWLDKYQ